MRRIVAVALAVALLTGCGSGDDDPPAAAPAASSTTVAAARCPDLSGSAVTVESSTAPGDFDGDGRADRLVAARVSAGGAWRLRMELAAGGGAETELPATTEGVKSVGGAVVDVGPSQVAFAVVGQGAAGVNVGLFVLRACKVERVVLAGKPAEFAVRTSAGARSGLACQVPGLVAYQATTTDGRFYQAATTSYLVLGGVLDEVHRSTSTLGADEAPLVAYGKFTCGSLSL